MNSVHNEISRNGIRFFGKVSASISHEINNSLAVMNEKAGLLEDFCLMSAQGKPLDPERITALARELLQQINRAHDIVKLLNRFAHSSDEPVRQINMEELLNLVLGVSERPATLRGVRLTLSTSEPVMVVSNPFALQNLICRNIEFALMHAGTDKQIQLALSNASPGAGIRFRGLQGLADENPELFPGEDEKHLMGLLGVDIQVIPSSNEIVLVIPERIADGSDVVD